MSGLAPLATKRLQVDNVTARSLSDFGFTAEQIAKAKYAVVTARESAAIYTATDGDQPASSFGTLIPEDSTVQIADGDVIGELVFLSDTSTKAAITIRLEG